MASKRVEMLFAKKNLFFNRIVQYNGDREVFEAWLSKVLSFHQIISVAKKTEKVNLAVLTAVFYDSILLYFSCVGN